MPDAHSSPPIHQIAGTAGHVDHGKSALVRALTGTDPDRLAEEKARALTIDLGFAWKRTADGSLLSFIDVPGHERFIKNMLAGVGGIDAVMLVIAADEGPMPQTREHLAIIDLLGIQNGVVALSKSDLVDDDWRELVTEEIRATLDGTSLAGAPIIPCSAITRDGLDHLERELLEQLRTAPGRTDRGRPRLSVDRAFTLAGFGTVVTGTLIDGQFRVGDEIELLPRRLRARIRGLQVHNTRVEQAEPGTRVAINLAGLPLEQVHRGDLLALPDRMQPSQRVDLRLRLLASAPAPLKQDDPVDLFAGASETGAWVSPLDRDELAPGESGWAQLRTKRPVTLAAGDRVIIRRPSPSDTIGGGLVVDPTPSRHRRFDEAVLAHLTSRERGDPEELLLHALHHQIVPRSELATIAGESGGDILEALIVRGLAVSIGNASVTSIQHWESLKTRAAEAVAAFHDDQPRRRGMPRDDLRDRLTPGNPVAFDQLVNELVAAGQLVDEQRTLRAPTFEIRIDADEREAADRWLQAIESTPFSPPPAEQFSVPAATVLALREREEIVQVNEQIVLTPSALQTVESAVLSVIDGEGWITLASYRDRFGTSRKYAQAMLEFFDQRRVTRRIGDDRVRFRARTESASRGGD